MIESQFVGRTPETPDLFYTTGEVAGHLLGVMNLDRPLMYLAVSDLSPLWVPTSGPTDTV